MTNYIRIKINTSKANKEKGFYLLMTNGNTYSDVKDEYVIEKRFLEILNKNKIHYTTVSNKKK